MFTGRPKVGQREHPVLVRWTSTGSLMHPRSLMRLGVHLRTPPKGAFFSGRQYICPGLRNHAPTPSGQPGNTASWPFTAFCMI